jgi:hypothetical protein
MPVDRETIRWVGDAVILVRACTPLHCYYAVNEILDDATLGRTELLLSRGRGGWALSTGTGHCAATAS